ncbi:Precorrin-6A reductase [Phaeobacter sp. CECT 5382]|uniref:cobalt-precorrin-6A reductase n=1 Tax=Phaeobacter sp. CECT 5382 TaxID=1712645 RepID=UPI0006D99913|nr:cobalt-precorrin-6A reductase [Phaeobacter sp. CECT 5382]CUH88023.1 Precorrin-6A reductase [Phaeobacter sp. CECT 5382]
MTRTLLLGGTTEATRLARALAEAGADAVFSYAGRTHSPVAQPLPTRVGGFGGVAGFVDYLRAEAITHVVDATHPFAAQMSRNVIAACDATGVPLCAFERPAWQAAEGDRWIHVADMASAVAALPETPMRVFLAIGKQNLNVFAVKPQHHYLLRLVDAPETELPLPDCAVELARGPFDLAGDLELLRHHRITHIVAKNAGGTGAMAKLTAARKLDLPIVMINRPELPTRQVLGDLAEVMAWLFHASDA